MSAETILIEILGSHGRVQSRERITLSREQRTFTIGRSVQADVTLDDAHAAAMHATVEITPEGRILVSDLGSINGVGVSGKRQGDAKNLEVTDGALLIGRTRLRIRTAHETLAPEKPDPLRPASILRDPAWIAGAGALVGGLQLAYTSWLGAPRDLATVIVTTLISGVLAAGAWVAFWALLSRVMQNEWRWLRHAAIFLGVAAIFVAIDGLLELGWFIFSLPQWSTRPAWVGAVAFGCALYLHLIHASSITVRRAALVACIVPALSGGAGQWLQARYQLRDVNHIASSVRIYPPSLRLRAAGTSEDYFRSTAALRDAADKTRKAMRVDDEDDESSDDE
jgi:hypothetical protein